jgi:VWFA-related protein
MESRSRPTRQVAAPLVAFSPIRTWIFFTLACFVVCLTPARGQSEPQKPTAPAAVADSAASQNSAELASHDEPIAFKANANLVVLRAVVRDPQGAAIGNLRKEDFQVFDKGKPQAITQFEVEGTGIPATAGQTAEPVSGNQSSATGPHPGENPPAMPGRFVAYLFDDVHLEFGDLAHVRDAATRHFVTLRPTDRAAIFTTSGLVSLDFTSDRAKLNEALLHLRPQPNRSTIFEHQCPDITLYEADLIINKRDPDAKQIAANEAQQCSGGDPALLVQNVAQMVLSAGRQQSLLTLGSLQQVVHSVSRMPGERSIIVVSPGFLTPELDLQFDQIVDRAVRSQVVISAFDARGLFVTIPYGDASQQSDNVPGDTAGMGVPASKSIIETNAAEANDDALAALADGTGGAFFHNDNDFKEGFRRVAESPEYSYILGFVPQNLKLDGSFHALKVTLKNPQKFTLQARRGYFAPKSSLSPEEQSKEEIQDAMYSQEEIHDLPVTLHTQFFKANDDDAKLIVLAHVDVKQLRFRKLQGRNDNVLTCVFALFNSNGRFVEGMQKTVTLDLKDETLEHRLASGITLKTSFNVKPGSYLVRLVVRDAEAKLMSAENGALEIR